MPAPKHRSDGPPLELGKLVEALDRHRVEYLLVGGSAAGLHGAERPTEDADCVVRRERGNLDRLASALRELNARLRVGGMTDAEARTLPVQIDGTALDMASTSTWMTDAGRPKDHEALPELGEIQAREAAQAPPTALTGDELEQ